MKKRIFAMIVICMMMTCTYCSKGESEPDVIIPPTDEPQPEEPQESQITLTTSRSVGQAIELTFKKGSMPAEVVGATKENECAEEYDLMAVTYRLTDQTVILKGEIESLYCDENDLVALDVSKCAGLELLECSYNEQLKTIDVTNNRALECLSASSIGLTKLDLSKNTELLELLCFDNKLTAIDLSKCTKLYYLLCNNSDLKELDVSKNLALEYLYCSDCSLTELDVSKNVELLEVVCYGNKIKTLDFSKNHKMTYLYCSENELTSLIIGNWGVLEYLNCGNNQLSHLDSSGGKVLKTLLCQRNQLTTLKVDKNNDKLDYIYCCANRLAGENSTEFVKSLPDRTGLESGKLYTIADETYVGIDNEFSLSDIEIAQRKNWIVD